MQSPNGSTNKTSSAKLSITFKYDKSGILTLKKAEVHTTSSTSYPLKTSTKLAGPSPLTKAQKAKCKKHLRAYEKRDKTLEKLKIIMNEYESLIYSTRDILEDEDYQPYLKSEVEKQKLNLFLDEEEEWLYSDKTKNEYNTVKAKLKILEKKINPMKKRRQARQQIPEEIEIARRKIDEHENSFRKYTKRRSWIKESILEEFETLVVETREYFDEKVLNFKMKFINNYVLDASA